MRSRQKLIANTLLVVGLIGLFSLFLTTGTYVYLADCSAGGVRTSAMIDDMDRTSGCLNLTLRKILLVITPLLWCCASAALIWLRQIFIGRRLGIKHE